MYKRWFQFKSCYVSRGCVVVRNVVPRETAIHAKAAAEEHLIFSGPGTSCGSPTRLGSIRFHDSIAYHTDMWQPETLGVVLDVWNLELDYHLMELNDAAFCWLIPRYIAKNREKLHLRCILSGRKKRKRKWEKRSHGQQIKGNLATAFAEQ